MPTETAENTTTAAAESKSSYEQVRNRVFSHPKSSVTGVLLATLTIAGVLQQQGVTLGHAGTGSTVALVSGLATAVLGLLAKD